MLDISRLGYIKTLTKGGAGKFAVEAAILHDAHVIVPVRNGGTRWREAAEALERAVPDPALVTVIDSSSTDGSDIVALDHRFGLERIDVRTFNHGRTRQSAVNRFCRDKKFVIFLTQDAIVDGPDSFANLLHAFADPSVGASFGRQLPHRDATPIEAHFVKFNYRAESETRSFADASRLGIKAAYISNSFAAYRTAALWECGGFPDHLILGEDTYVALKMLQGGWRMRYCAEAVVRHSHAYSIVRETQRYFDFGVLHAQLPELLASLGAAEGEGARFAVSEMRYVLDRAPLSLPAVVVRNGAKYLAYRLGRAFKWLPRRLCRHLSMTKGYWDAAATGGRLPYEMSR